MATTFLKGVIRRMYCQKGINTSLYKIALIYDYYYCKHD